MSEQWKKDHEEQYGKIDEQKRLPKPKRRRKTPPGTVRVSQAVEDLIQDLEGAYMALFAADTNDREAVGNAYSALKQRQLELYQRIEVIEKALGLWRPVTKRFI